MDNLKTKVFSGFAWKFAERLLSQAITFIVSLVIARILSPTDYGLVAMVLIFTNIATVIVSNGFSAALIQGEDVNESDFSTIFYCSLLISIVLYIVLYVFAPNIAHFYGEETIIPIIRIFSLILPLASLNSIQNAYISKKMEFNKNFYATLLGSIISGSCGIILAVKGFGVWALVAQYMCNLVVNCIALFFLISWRLSFNFNARRAVPLLKFGANVLGADLIGTIFNQLNSFVMGKFYTPSDLAYYNRGQSFPQLVNGNISSIVASVMFPAFSTTSSDMNRLKGMAKKTTKMMTYILCPLYFGMIAVSSNLITLLLTEKWLPAVPFLCIVCIACVLGTISPIDIQILKAVGRSDIVLKLEFIKKPVWLLLVVLAIQKGVYAVAWVLPIACIIEILVNGIAVKKCIGYSLFEKTLDWLKSIIPSVIMFALVYSINWININTIFLLIFQVCAGILIYLVYSLVTKNENFIYFMSVVKRKRLTND